MTLIGDVMIKDPIVCTPDQPVEELLAMFRHHDISGMPVVDAQGDLVGVVSASDVLRKQRGCRVRDLMTTRCWHVGEFTTVRQAAQLMALNRVHRLVVTSGQRRVVGVITSLDLVEFLSKLPESTTSRLQMEP